MSLRVFNSLTRKLEDFSPQGASITIYSCGPTVYDHVHIGNLRTYIFEDTLRRVLRSGGQTVDHVMNITDVDDKTIERSKQDFPSLEPMEALKKLTKQYENKFMNDVEKLSIDLSTTRIARATDHIQDMQDMILDIPNRYATDDGVYFSIEEYKEYGKLVKLDREHGHHRIQNDEYDKDHVADFALWKARKTGEPYWDFEIEGETIPGRPGWHIECSAMSAKYLSVPFDIHTGGVDLKFPHHENEMAQIKAATGKDISRIFIHSEHLLVEGKKMSKSLSNFYTLNDIVAKGYDPLAFRLLVLQTHYRTQLNFSWDSLGAAGAFLQSLRRLGDLALQPGTGQNLIDKAEGQQIKERMTNALHSDLNSAGALSELAKLSDNLSGVSIEGAAILQDILKFSDNLLGLGISDREDISESDKKMIAKRNDLKRSGDFASADALRNTLKEKGIALNDTADASVWFRVDS